MLFKICCSRLNSASDVKYTKTDKSGIIFHDMRNTQSFLFLSWTLGTKMNRQYSSVHDHNWFMFYFFLIFSPFTTHLCSLSASHYHVPEQTHARLSRVCPFSPLPIHLFCVWGGCLKVWMDIQNCFQVTYIDILLLGVVVCYSILYFLSLSRLIFVALIQIF